MFKKTKTETTIHPGKLILGYARTAGQNGASISRQNLALAQYCKTAFRSPLDHTYEDRGGDDRADPTSGFNFLKADIESGHTAVVVVFDMDRISRSSTVLNNFRRLCLNMGVELHTCTGGRQDLRAELTPSFRGYFTVLRAKLKTACSAAGRARAKAAKTRAA